MTHRSKLKYDSVRFVDLFAGMGGLRLGFEQAMSEMGIEAKCILTSEVKPHAVKVLKDNFRHNEFKGDITETDERFIPDFDVLLGGFPCQAFSFAGRRDGFADTRGTLFFDIERILKEKKPKAFILENVEGLIRHDYVPGNKKGIGRTLSTILSSLEGLGYFVDWSLLDASDMGVAQKRKRVFIVGRMDRPVHLANFEVKKELLKDVLIEGLPTRRTEFTDKLLSHYTPAELIGKRVNDRRGGSNNIHSWSFDLKGETSDRQKNLLSNLLRVRRQKRWADIIGIKWMDGMPLTAEQIFTFADEYSSIESLEVDLKDLVDKGYLAYEHPKDIVATNGVNRREYREDLAKGYNIIAGNLSFEYNRILSPEDVSPTLVATDMKKIGVIDKGGIRPLSVRESLRLFGYPDNFKMNVCEASAYDLLGNTVVVPVVKEVAKKLFRSNDLT